jgi:hypothetical protein
MRQDLRETLHDPEEGRGIALMLLHIQDAQAELEHRLLDMMGLRGERNIDSMHLFQSAGGQQILSPDSQTEPARLGEQIFSNPDDADLWALLAASLGESGVIVIQGARHSGLTASKRAIELDPRNRLAWTILGLRLPVGQSIQIGEEVLDAPRACARALECPQPSNLLTSAAMPELLDASSCWHRLGSLLGSRGVILVNGARLEGPECVRRAIALKPDNPEHWKTLARILAPGQTVVVGTRTVSNGDCILIALDLHPGDPVSWEMLGRALSSGPALRLAGRELDSQYCFVRAARLRGGESVGDPPHSKGDLGMIQPIIRESAGSAPAQATAVSPPQLGAVAPTIGPPQSPHFLAPSLGRSRTQSLQSRKYRLESDENLVVQYENLTGLRPVESYTLTTKRAIAFAAFDVIKAECYLSDAVVAARNVREHRVDVLSSKTKMVEGIVQNVGDVVFFVSGQIVVSFLGVEEPPVMVSTIQSLQAAYTQRRLRDPEFGPKPSFPVPEGTKLCGSCFGNGFIVCEKCKGEGLIRYWSPEASKSISFGMRYNYEIQKQQRIEAKRKISAEWAAKEEQRFIDGKECGDCTGRGSRRCGDCQGHGLVYPPTPPMTGAGPKLLWQPGYLEKRETSQGGVSITELMAFRKRVNLLSSLPPSERIREMELLLTELAFAVSKDTGVTRGDLQELLERVSGTPGT